MKYIIFRKKKKGGWVSNKEIAESLNIEPPSVSGMLEKLKKKGLIKWEPRKSIRLTEKGKKIAKQLNETHYLLYQFFAKVLKIEDEDVIENLSCEIEHHITHDVKNSLEEFLLKYLDG
ncbi:MAG: metal-dependent transcriptional regulator [Promethearchaeota archaeon]